MASKPPPPNNNGSEEEDDRKPAARRTPNMDDVVQNLARDPSLIEMIERGIASMLAESQPAAAGRNLQDQSNDVNQHTSNSNVTTRDAVTRRVIQQVLNDNPNILVNRHAQQNATTAVATSTASTTRLKESKTVSFSSVSAPNLFAEPAPLGSRSNSDDGRISPPPILSTSPTRMNTIADAIATGNYHPSSNNIVLENQLRSLSPLSGSGHSSSFGAGEPTASGDSSFASVSASGGSQTGGRSSQVRFSALNPNPHLVLRSNDDENGGSSNRVSFTIDRAVSWEFDAGQPGTQGSSRGSRSGLSSPSLEPPLSPLSRSRSASQGSRDVSFNDSAIEVITEAAARLRNDADENLDAEESSTTARSVPPRLPRVHFSAMREVVPSGSSDDNNVDPPPQALDSKVTLTASEHHVHFATDDTNQHVNEAAVSSGVVYSTTEDEMMTVADRLRRVIRRAEQLGNLTLEDAFAQFDSDHSGTITAEEFQISLRRLGSSFEFSLEECTALIACLTGQGNSRVGEMNLLTFYRAMGRRSPPLPSNEPSVAHMDLAESPAVHAVNAASRLRAYILETEQVENHAAIESTFRAIDVDHSGYITAEEFHEGLRNLGNDNESNLPTLDDEDCEELVAIFDANKDGKVSLIDFYRFMGRRSPPLEEPSNIDDQLVKRRSGKSSEGDIDTNAAEHDHFSEFLARKRRDDEDDEGDLGGGSRGFSTQGSQFSSAGAHGKVNPNSNDKAESSSGGTDGKAGNESKASSFEQAEDTWNGELNALGSFPPEIVEVILKQEKCEKSRAGLLPLLLNDNENSFNERKEAIDFTSAPIIRRDDVDDRSSADRMDAVRISVECVKRKTKRRAQMASTAVVERALDDIEIDHEQNNVSPVPFFCTAAKYENESFRAPDVAFSDSIGLSLCSMGRGITGRQSKSISQFDETERGLDHVDDAEADYMASCQVEVTYDELEDESITVVEAHNVFVGSASVSTLGSPDRKVVQFTEDIVSGVREIPTVASGEVGALFYSSSDLDRFEEEAYDEEYYQRGQDSPLSSVGSVMEMDITDLPPLKDRRSVVCLSGNVQAFMCSES
eukprot:CAMPEP_0116009760 /NCGR_PEP_ID=MMETSP0321-20121206/3614_1 /TAXON_ID=163516 /ORGANISM="Leptocylindrus danicus var. danicus, Strain B650" /LENGTH=1074 /DNA_ID=CAMNT_0003478763 /DNA_START=213 /DNA_END=3437 /DNA_ORIENTATION=+